MSLIEKIDAEIVSIKRILVGGTFTEEVYGILMGKIQMAERIKQLILSEQKEPCKCDKCPSDFCVVSFGKECPLSDGKLKSLTIGDKIRENNESLSEFIRGQFGDDRVFRGGNQIDLDDFLNQPSTK